MVEETHCVFCVAYFQEEASKSVHVNYFLKNPYNIDHLFMAGEISTY